MQEPGVRAEVQERKERRGKVRRLISLAFIGTGFAMLFHFGGWRVTLSVGLVMIGWDLWPDRFDED